MATEYDHTQKGGYIGPILMLWGCIALAVCFGLYFWGVDPNFAWATYAVPNSSMLFLIGASFLTMRVTIDQDGMLMVRFGPLPLFYPFSRCCGNVNLARAEKATVESYNACWGYGVRMTMVGFMFRLWGNQVVRVHIGGTYKDILIGSDDAENLCAAIQRNIDELSNCTGLIETTLIGTPIVGTPITA